MIKLLSEGFELPLSCAFCGGGVEMSPMFTGIVKGLFPVGEVKKHSDLTQYQIVLPEPMRVGLEMGASVSIDGVCQSVVQIEGDQVWFDAIEETLNRTTLGQLYVGRRVNVERSARMGDEIGGHLLSGHVFGKARVCEIQTLENHSQFTFECDPQWMKYFFTKGYVAIDGASLTLVDVRAGQFSVHLIPETLRVTTLGFKRVGDEVNIEFDSQTQAIVDTVERVLGLQKLFPQA
jgi:riboflavin synthase